MNKCNESVTQPPASGKAAHTVLLSCYCHKAFVDALDAIAHADVPPAHPEYLTKGRMAEVAAFALQCMAEFKPENAEGNDRLAFIVRACNSHAGLVAALEASERALAYREKYDNDRAHALGHRIMPDSQTLTEIRAELAKAKGVQP
jgi:hypothetical protein